MPDSVDINGKNYVITEIGDRAFSRGITYPGEGNPNDGSPLKGVVFNKSMRKIGKRAFVDNSLSQIEFNDGLLEIGDEAFAHCNGGDVTLPQTLQQIGF